MKSMLSERGAHTEGGRGSSYSSSALLPSPLPSFHAGGDGGCPDPPRRTVRRRRESLMSHPHPLLWMPGSFILGALTNKGWREECSLQPAGGREGGRAKEREEGDEWQVWYSCPCQSLRVEHTEEDLGSGGLPRVERRRQLVSQDGRKIDSTTHTAGQMRKHRGPCFSPGYVHLHYTHSDIQPSKCCPQWLLHLD